MTRCCFGPCAMIATRQAVATTLGRMSASSVVARSVCAFIARNSSGVTCCMRTRAVEGEAVSWPLALACAQQRGNLGLHRGVRARDDQPDAMHCAHGASSGLVTAAVVEQELTPLSRLRSRASAR